MQTFDTYGNVLLKIGPCNFCIFQVGDQVPLPDGIYCGAEGFVVVKSGIFIMEQTTIQSTWDTTIFSSDCFINTRLWLPDDTVTY